MLEQRRSEDFVKETFISNESIPLLEGPADTLTIADFIERKRFLFKIFEFRDEDGKRV